ncbi:MULTISPECIES: hypothetical protein [Aequorivita]|uniref:Type II secretion system protein n=1 Tax=Aequorivita iocasae TaxID=2803865 RepID=A0ABX7DSN8_9FLAO|nr:MULTISPECIES: hypothetical protein [Aequorivita]QQX76502.1 hypothetical protein JK629_14435 [Aequorivita iocasae]UCA55975.1 hypothetical protein LDL78_14505 [Aequorivita sp. F7]
MTISSRIKGASLIETVIAITIITICSLVATLLYSKIVQQAPPLQKYESSSEINKLMEAKNYKPFKKEYEGYSIEGRIPQKFKDEDRLGYFEFVITSEKDTFIVPVLNFRAIDEH